MRRNIKIIPKKDYVIYSKFELAVQKYYPNNWKQIIEHSLKNKEDLLKENTSYFYILGDKIKHVNGYLINPEYENVYLFKKTDNKLSNVAKLINSEDEEFDDNYCIFDLFSILLTNEVSKILFINTNKSIYLQPNIDLTLSKDTIFISASDIFIATR